MKTDNERIEKIVGQVCGECKVISAKRMGGLTNCSYHVMVKKEGESSYAELAVRLPGKGTEKLINRADEKKSTQLACLLGIEPTLYWFDEMTGEKVSAFVSEGKTLHGSDLRQEENILRVAEIFTRLHTCKENTGVRFDVLGKAKDYDQLIRNSGGSFWCNYSTVEETVQKLWREDAFTVEYVPCHNDPLSENWILRDDGRMYLIDWEYAGMNDPMWDLADVSLEAEMTPLIEELLLQTYLGRKPKWYEQRRFEINKIAIDFLWSLWGKARATYDGPCMEKYACERWQRMWRNLQKLENVGV